MFILDKDTGSILDEMHERSLDADFGDKSEEVSVLTSALKNLAPFFLNPAGSGG